MRYCFTLLLALFVVLASAQSKREKKAVKTYKIKSITEFIVETIGGKEVPRKDSYTAYNKDADVLVSEEYKKDGTLKHKETAKYDSNGNKIEETVWDAAELKPNPEEYFKYLSKYDFEDNKTEELSYDKDNKLISKTLYSYNSSGNRSLEVVYDPAGKVIRKIIYSYNAKGLRVEKKEYDGNNVLIVTRKYQYEF